MGQSAVVPAQIVDIADQRVLGNVSGSTGSATALTQAQTRTFLGLGTAAYETASYFATAANAALTGTPTAPTAIAGTNTTQIATTAFVTTAVGAVDLSPYVPYTGATTNLNMGAFGVTAATMTTTGAHNIAVSGQPIVGINRNTTIGGLDIYGNSVLGVPVNVGTTVVTLASDVFIGWSGSNVTQPTDARIARYATGPAVESRAAGGFRSRTLNGSADAPITCSTLTASGASSVLAPFQINGPSGGGNYLKFDGTDSSHTYIDNTAPSYLFRKAGGVDSGYWISLAPSITEARIVTPVRMNLCSDSGVRVRNQANSADAPITCAALTASGLVTLNGNNDRLRLINGSYTWNVGQNALGLFYIEKAANTGVYIDYSGNVGIGTSSPSSLLTVAGAATFSGPTTTSATFIPGSFTVATLPSTSAAGRVTGARATVTDSNATITAGIGAIVAGGGTDVVCVMWDGTNWRIA